MSNQIEFNFATKKQQWTQLPPLLESCTKVTLRGFINKTHIEQLPSWITKLIIYPDGLCDKSTPLYWKNASFTHLQQLRTLIVHYSLSMKLFDTLPVSLENLEIFDPCCDQDAIPLIGSLAHLVNLKQLTCMGFAEPSFIKNLPVSLEYIDFSGFEYYNGKTIPLTDLAYLPNLKNVKGIYPPSPQKKSQ